MSKIRARRKYRHAIRKAENIRIFDENMELQVESHSKKLNKIDLYNKKSSKEEKRISFLLLTKKVLIFFKNLILFNYFKSINFRCKLIKEIQQSDFYTNDIMFSEEFFQITKKDNNALQKVFSFFFF